MATGPPILSRLSRNPEGCLRPAASPDAFTWPHAKSLQKESYSSNDSKQPETLVEFRLEKAAYGTLLTVTESGFEDIPRDRRLEPFRRKKAGGPSRSKKIDKYVSEKN